MFLVIWRSYCFYFQVGEANVDTALSLVGYDKELESAMKFVFGSSFVALDLDSAKKVIFAILKFY